MKVIVFLPYVIPLRNYETTLQKSWAQVFSRIAYSLQSKITVFLWRSSPITSQGWPPWKTVMNVVDCACSPLQHRRERPGGRDCVGCRPEQNYIGRVMRAETQSFCFLRLSWFAYEKWIRTGDEKKQIRSYLISDVVEWGSELWWKWGKPKLLRCGWTQYPSVLVPELFLPQPPQPSQPSQQGASTESWHSLMGPADGQRCCRRELVQ